MSYSRIVTGVFLALLNFSLGCFNVYHGFLNFFINDMPVWGMFQILFAALSFSVTMVTIMQVVYQLYGPPGIVLLGHFVNGDMNTPNKGSPPYQGPEVPYSQTVLVGEVIGWRAWRLIQDDLYSVWVNASWNPNEPMMGDVGKGFGIHAYKSLETVKRTYPHCIYGSVALWGDLVEHSNGYRAEYGRVLSVDAPPSVKSRYERWVTDGAEEVESYLWTGR